MKAVVLGTGRMGRRHIDVVRRAGLQLVGIADPRAESLAAAKSEFGLSDDLLEPDAGKLLRNVKAEVVIVSTTAPTHGELTCAAAQAGARFVLCEKPMATSLAECTRMIETCAKSGTALAINHQMRVMEQYTKIREIIEGQDFGGWSSINVIAGNFGIAMNGTHYFELLRWLADSEPAMVSAQFDEQLVPSPRGREFADRSGVVRVTTKSGKRLVLEVGVEHGHGVRVVYAGKWGMATADELRGHISVSCREAQYRDLPTTRYGMPARHQEIEVAPADAVEPSLRVLERLLSGSDYPTGQDGRSAVAAFAAAVVSNESGGRAVPVDLASLPVTRTFDYA